MQYIGLIVFISTLVLGMYLDVHKNYKDVCSYWALGVTGGVGLTISYLMIRSLI